MGRKTKIITGLCLACGDRFTKQATRGNQLMACAFSPCIEKARNIAKTERNNRKFENALDSYHLANDRFSKIPYHKRMHVMTVLYEELSEDNAEVSVSFRRGMTAPQINARKSHADAEPEKGLSQAFFSFCKEYRGGISPADLFRKNNSPEQAMTILAAREAAKATGYTPDSQPIKIGAVAWLLGDDAALTFPSERTFAFDDAEPETAPQASQEAQTAPIMKGTDTMPAFPDFIAAEQEIALRFGQYRFRFWDAEAKAYKTNRKPMNGYDFMQVAGCSRLDALAVILHNRSVGEWDLAEAIAPTPAPANPEDVLAAIRQTFHAGTGTKVSPSVVVSLVQDRRPGETFATVHILHDAEVAELSAIRDAISSGVPQGYSVFIAEGGKHYHLTKEIAA